MPEYRIELNVKKGSSGFVKKPKLTMRQGEKNSTLVVASIRDADIGYDLTGKTVEFRATVPGGRIVVDDDPERVVIVDGKNGVVSYLMPSRVAAEPGSINNAYFDVYTSVGEYEISTESFSIEVYDGVDLTNEAAADYIPKFDRITAEAQAATAAANDAAKSASETNESVKSAEAERAGAESTRAQNESWRAEAENARAVAENGRADAEAARSTAEDGRVRAERSRVAAEAERERTISGFAAAVAAGEFDGAAAGFGDIEVTVDDGVGVPGVVVTESGPDTAKSLRLDFKNLKGERGSDGNGITTSLDPGFFTMSVEPDGHLYVTHNDNEPAPPLSIRDGKLIYTIN